MIVLLKDHETLKQQLSYSFPPNFCPAKHFYLVSNSHLLWSNWNSVQRKEWTTISREKIFEKSLIETLKETRKKKWSRKSLIRGKNQHFSCNISRENVCWTLKNLQTFVWLGVCITLPAFTQTSVNFSIFILHFFRWYYTQNAKTCHWGLLK